MIISSIIGWMILGAVASACLVKFWDNIRDWLNNVAADAVEKALGYEARQRMHRAISTIDKFIDKVKNKSIVYTKRNNLDTYYDKTTIIAEAPVYEIESGVLEEIKKKGSLIQEFEYKH